MGMFRTTFFFLMLSAPAWAAPLVFETHVFQIKGEVQYRCYTGPGKPKARDSRTDTVCDNKTQKKVLFDEKVSLKIQDEPDPEMSKDLEGAWDRVIPYKGRNFEIALSLFKTHAGPKPIYRLRMVAVDDEPTTRKTAVYEEGETVKSLAPLTMDYVSVGQPEEITFTVTLKPL